MELALLSLMVEYAPLAALVNNRIFWDEIPQSTTRPCIVMFVVSQTTDYTFEGQDPLVQTSVQIDCQATTPALKRAVAAAVHDLLSGYRGIVDDVQFSGVFRTLTRDTTEKPASGALLKIRQQRYDVWSKPAP